METAKKNAPDLINGPIFKNLFTIAFPLALSGILQLLFHSADLIVISQFSSTPEQSLAAVSSNGPLAGIITNLAIGLSVGANVVMAQSIGAKNFEKAQKTLHTSIFISLILGVVFGAIGALLSRQMLIWTSVDPIILDRATIYLQIIFLGFPASCVYNFSSAILRAKGDTKRPLFILTIAGATNVVLNIILVLSGLDVAGVAIATVASQTVSAILLVILLFREQDYCKLSVKRLKLSGAEFFEIMRVGIPSGVLSTCFTFANVLVQSAINSFGYVVVAGNAAGNSIEGFSYTSFNAVASAVMPLIAQNYGAGKYKRIPKIIGCAFLLVMLVWAVICGLSMLLVHPLSLLYVNDPYGADGQLMLYYAAVRVFSILPLYFLHGMMEVVINSLKSMNHVLFPSIVHLVFVVGLKVLWYYVLFPLPQMHSLFGILSSWPVTWICVLLFEGIHLIVVCRSLLKKIKSEKAQENEEKFSA